MKCKHVQGSTELEKRRTLARARLECQNRIRTDASVHWSNVGSHSTTLLLGTKERKKVASALETHQPLSC